MEKCLILSIFVLMSTFLNDINGHYANEKKAILALCDKGMAYSVADLAKELGTSIPKVTRIVGEMLEDGYLADLGKQESAGGRRLLPWSGARLSVGRTATVSS